MNLNSIFNKIFDNEKVLKLAELSLAFEWHKWRDEIPYLSFPAHWQVKIIPPFVTGIVRFVVRTSAMKDNLNVSIYLDCYDIAGVFGEPYWEVFDTDDVHRFAMGDTQGMLECIALALAALASDASSTP